VRELLDTVIGRILDHLGLAHALTRRWGGDVQLEKRS
jgi:3-polyprenyl-4-hydroxybenzoate decarboxylase